MLDCDWSSDVCSSDFADATEPLPIPPRPDAARSRPASATGPAATPPAARPAAGNPPLPGDDTLRAKVEDVVLSALLSDFKAYRKGETPSAPTSKPADRQLDSMLESFKGARDRAAARRGATAGQKSFDLEAATDGSSRASQHAGVGTILKNRFVLDRLLGRGGMGEVFAAVDRRKLEALERHPYVAVKVLNDEFRRHPDALRALESEARRAQELAHPNIVNVFDFDRDGRVVFITMELLHGKPLDEVIRQNGNLSQADALRYIDGMCRAVAHAHKQGVIHADLKPANVFILDDGTVKVLDFGIAGAVDRTEEKRPGGGGGRAGASFDPESLGMLTRAYASPEMILGEARDPRDDVFALGIIAYQLLSGRHPFDRRPATEWRDKGRRPLAIPRLGGRRRKAIDGALAYDRAKRTASVEAFRRALIEPGFFGRIFGRR
jgi:predicted Ser/Thr protein kinase